MEDQNALLIRLLASLAIGLLVGIESGWSDREEIDGNRIAGYPLSRPGHSGPAGEKLPPGR